MASELLRLSNFDSVNESARTTSAESAEASQDQIELLSPSGFLDEQFVVIDPESESAELRQIDSLAGQTLTLKSNLSFTHPAGARVIQLRGNQLKVYRADDVDGTVPEDDAFAAYPTTAPINPISIHPDQSSTEVTDVSGGQGYWYKAVYFNSVTSEETDLSWAVAVRGGDYGHYAILDDIRDEAGFGENSYIDDGVVSRARDAAEAEITGILATTGYALPFSVEVPLIRSLTTQLAAAKLLIRDYGVGADGTSKDGRALTKEVRETLKQILSREIVLVDASGTLLLQLASNDTSSNDSAETCERDPIFTMEDSF